jgi:hypothetical protein
MADASAVIRAALALFPEIEHMAAIVDRNWKYASPEQREEGERWKALRDAIQLHSLDN